METALASMTKTGSGWAEMWTNVSPCLLGVAAQATAAPLEHPPVIGVHQRLHEAGQAVQAV